MNWEYFHVIDQDKFLENLTKFLEDWINFSEEEKNKYFQRFIKDGEKKECKVTFLSRVLKYSEDTLFSSLYNYISHKKKFQKKIKRIRELYFQINPRCQKNIEFNKERIKNLINNTPSYILNKAYLADQLNYSYSTLVYLICPLEEICSSLEEKVLNQREDFRNDFLKLLEEAPKEAFKSHEYLFYYLLLKEFSHFKLFDNKTDESMKKKSDFIKKCKNLYTKKVSYKSNIFSKGQIFSFFKKKFKDFHDIYDYKTKLKILEEKKKNYPDCFDDKDHNELLVNNKLNNSNDSCTEGVINISPINSPDYENSNNGNKRKLDEEGSNEIVQNNYKKRLIDQNSKQNLDNSATSDSQSIQEQKSYTNFSIENILGIKRAENQNLLNHQ